MKAVLALALLWQMAAVSSNDPIAEPRHFQYQRPLTLAPSTTPQTCAILDASTFAHAATESLNDLRLYATIPHQPPTETPFNFSVSGTQSSEDDPATLRNLGVSNNNLVFDLEMPARPYSAVVLNLAATDFLATAHVNGSDGHGGPSTDLGAFALFDLSSQHLSRSTTLPLQEATFPELHITLHLTPAPNSPPHDLGPTIVHGATIPPSREAQTLFTPVASTTKLSQHGRFTIARIQIPAHVPVDRISFTLDPRFTRNFLRTVNIAALHPGPQDATSTETLTGAISHVKLTPSPTDPPIDNQQLTLDAALGANLRTAALVEVSLDNGDDPPLPIASVQLEMRQRKLCFDATPAATYVLMYGDPALRAPIYDYATLFTPISTPAIATLATEQRNPTFLARLDTRPYTERHPELLWVTLLAVIGILGSIALRGARRRSH